MTDNTLHPLAVDYLDRLERAARSLPSERRRELQADIEAHLSEAIPPDASDADALNVLERLGPPTEIIAAELGATAAAYEPGTGDVGPESDVVIEPGAGPREWVTILLLLLGGFIFFVGWFVGLLLLWTSRSWTTVQKVIGTLVVPFGLAGISILVLSVSRTSGSASSCPPVAEPSGSHGVTAHWGCVGGASPGPNLLGTVLLVLIVVTPIATSIYLARSARRVVTRPTVAA